MKTTWIVGALLSIACQISVARGDIFYTENFDSDVSGLWEAGQRQWNFADGLSEFSPPIRPVVTSTPAWTGSTITTPVPTNGFPTSTITPTYRTQYIAVRSDLDAGNVYQNRLWGNLSAADQISATFRLSSSLTDGTSFVASNFWKMVPAPGNDGFAAHFRFFFIGDVHGGNDASRVYTTPGPDPLNPGEPYDAWFSIPFTTTYPNFSSGFAGGMKDNVYASLSVAMNNPNLWTSANGKKANIEASVQAEFNDARASVTRIGITMGGGNFATNGFAFADGGPTGGQVELTSFTVTPEPSSVVLILAGSLLAWNRGKRGAGRRLAGV
jgi:hypothetical protein